MPLYPENSPDAAFDRLRQGPELREADERIKQLEQQLELARKDQRRYELRLHALEAKLTEALLRNPLPAKKPDAQPKEG